MSAGGHSHVRPVVVAAMLPEEAVGEIVRRVIAALADQQAPATPEPWIGVDDAAAHLACSRKRIYDLVAQRRVRVRRDGRRLLFRRSWLDEALEEGPPPAEEVGRP